MKYIVFLFLLFYTISGSNAVEDEFSYSQEKNLFRTINFWNQDFMKVHLD